MTEKLNAEVKNFSVIRSILVILAVIAASYALAFTVVPIENLNAEDGNLGIW